MPRVSSSSIENDADVTGRLVSVEPLASTMLPCRINVSFSSSILSFTGLNSNVAVALVPPTGINMSKDSTFLKMPWASFTLRGLKSTRLAAPELGSTWTRTTVSTSLGSAGRRGASEGSPGQRTSGKYAVTVTSLRSALSGTDSKTLSMWVRDNTTSAGGIRSSSAMVARAVLVAPMVLAVATSELPSCSLKVSSSSRTSSSYRVTENSALVSPAGMYTLTVPGSSKSPGISLPVDTGVAVSWSGSSSTLYCAFLPHSRSRTTANTMEPWSSGTAPLLASCRLAVGR